MSKGRRPQPLAIRATHWINVPVLFILAMSGLRIFIAYPKFGPRGAEYARVPFSGWVPPDWMTIGHWLAGARNWHFAFAWIFTINAVVYVAYLVGSGEWRRRLFWPPRDARPALRQVAYYLRLRREAPPVDLYNGLQRAGYTGALALAFTCVASGLVVYKPVQLSFVAWAFGGYDGARVIHFYTMLGLGLFLVGHVIMVAAHPRSFVEMITGGKREA